MQKCLCNPLCNAYVVHVAESDANNNQHQHIMKTKITTVESERVSELLARHDEFADAMGIDSRVTDISEMSAEEIAREADIDIEDAEVIVFAAILADEPTIWGVFQFLFNYEA